MCDTRAVPVVALPLGLYPEMVAVVPLLALTDRTIFSQFVLPALGCNVARIPGLGVTFGTVTVNSACELLVET